MTTNGRIRVHALIDNLGCGGAELLLAEFAEPARSEGIDLTVGYLMGSLGDEAVRRLRHVGIEPELVPTSSMVGAQDLHRVRRHLSHAAPDVVHTHLGASDFLGAVAARSIGLPVVSTLHQAEWSAGSRRVSARLRLTALARRRCAGRIIAVSESARRAYLATGWDIPERVTVVHNGVADRPNPGGGRAVRRELGIAPDAPVVGMVSTLRPEKCHEVAFASIVAVRSRFPDVRLLVAGDGPTRPRLDALAHEVGDETVIMAGHRDDAMAVMDAADVLLHPSRIEAFPTVLLEAMAASVPIVAPAVGGIPEIMRDGEGGILLDPPPDPARVACALERLLGDPEVRRRMGAAGRRRFEGTFTLEPWTKGTRAVYDSVLRAEQGRGIRSRRSGRRGHEPR
jgi:glycosyltransferase involved in cell wall biosynthesis